MGCDRTAFDLGGELSAAAELRAVPGITDTAQARECARTIAGRAGRAMLRDRDSATCSDYGEFY